MSLSPSMMVIRNQDERIKIMDSMRKYETDINAFRWQMFCENYHYNEWQNSIIPEILGRYGIAIVMGDCNDGYHHQSLNRQQQLQQRFDQHRSQFEQLRHPRLRTLYRLINNYRRKTST